MTLGRSLARSGLQVVALHGRGARQSLQRPGRPDIQEASHGPAPRPRAIFTGTVGSHTTHLGSSRGRAGTRRPKVVQPNPTLLRLRLAWLPRSLLGPCLVPPVKTEMEAELDTTLCGPGLSSPRDSNPFSSPLHSRERFPVFL